VARNSFVCFVGRRRNPTTKDTKVHEGKPTTVCFVSRRIINHKGHEGTRSKTNHCWGGNNPTTKKEDQPLLLGKNNQPQRARRYPKESQPRKARRYTKEDQPLCLLDLHSLSRLRCNVPGISQPLADVPGLHRSRQCRRPLARRCFGRQWRLPLDS
jgi:hypothetical protein